MESKKLGSKTTLAKIDKLRELNVGAIIPLPQIVVVGDQSSGKSSVLESLTGFSFPRAVGLCTRYATQITCSREAIKGVSISIIPRPGADDELKAKLLSFQRNYVELTNDELSQAFRDANQVMGIRMSEDGKGIAFSEDILKIEISGPEEVHLTVIDVPGIFRVTTPGLTTEADIALVEGMVKTYMAHSRTIILAVIPCNIDAATQAILNLAKAADPDGVRTMGVLTKPDLALENATKKVVVDLLLGRLSKLALGYYAVKNRSADDSASSASERDAAETAFFAGAPWSAARDRCGVGVLRAQLSQLLMKLTNQELPNVRAEIAQKLSDVKRRLEAMGPSRGDESSQRLYLGKLAGRFQSIAQDALRAYYSSEKIFAENPNMRLMTEMVILCDRFSETLSTLGHLDAFGKDDEEEVHPQFERRSIFAAVSTEHDELTAVLEEVEYKCLKPLKGTLASRIRSTYRASRGPDLGTYGGSILSAIFEKETEKWTPLTLSYVSCAISLVHDFSYCLLSALCPEKQVKDQLWNELLVDRMLDLYREAMRHAHFLLDIERGGIPYTLNRHFNRTLQEKRNERTVQALDKLSFHSQDHEARVVPVDEFQKTITGKSNEDQACDDILDAFLSYYDIARERFADVLCQQVIFHTLLHSRDGPLRLFSPELVMGLGADELDAIAGEDEASRESRQALERDVANLEAALKVLRV